MIFSLFLVGQTFKECHLPDYVRPYWKLIDFCLNNHTSQESKHEYVEGTMIVILPHLLLSMTVYYFKPAPDWKLICAQIV